MAKSRSKSRNRYEAKDEDIEDSDDASPLQEESK